MNRPTLLCNTSLANITTVVEISVILTQFLHLKYTCGKHAVYNLSSVFTLFHSVIYNSAVKPKTFVAPAVLRILWKFHIHTSHSVAIPSPHSRMKWQLHLPTVLPVAIPYPPNLILWQFHFLTIECCGNAYPHSLYCGNSISA